MAERVPLARRVGVTALSVAVAEVVTLPVCTLKTVFITQPGLRTTAEAAAWVVGRWGWGGFFKASAPAVLAQVLSSTSKLLLYRDLQRVAAERGWTTGRATADNVACAVTSGLATAVVTHPLDVVRVHWQTGAAAAPSLRLAYRGFSKSASKVLVGSPLFMPIYDAARGWFAARDDISVSAQRLLASATSAVVSTTLMHPLEYLKTTHIYAGKSAMHGWDVRRYFRGLPLNLARIVLHFCIFVGGSEALLALLAEP
jgi:hypothetical protein